MVSVILITCLVCRISARRKLLMSKKSNWFPEDGQHLRPKHVGAIISN
jgi:hypothetical protein